jgi:hypothetical protein
MSGYQVTNPTFAVTLSGANNVTAQIMSLKASILPSASLSVNSAVGAGATSVIFPTTGGFIGGTVIFTGPIAAPTTLFFPFAYELYLAWQNYNLDLLGSQIPPSARVSTTTSPTYITNPTWGAPGVGSTCQFRIINASANAVTLLPDPADLGTFVGPGTFNIITNTLTIASREIGNFEMTLIDSGDLFNVTGIGATPYYFSPVLSIQKLNN